MKSMTRLTLVFSFSILATVCANAQTPTPAKSRDVGHEQKFWRDPADAAGMDVKGIERVKYMTAEFAKSATAVNASLSYLKKRIPVPGVHAGCVSVVAEVIDVSLTIRPWNRRSTDASMRRPRT